MIIISAGFRKSASTLLCNYQTDIIAVSAKRNGQKYLSHFSSSSRRAYRGDLDLKTFLILLYINFRYGDAVLKTHGSPTIYVKLLVKLGIAKVVYSYREPRDVALSMVDHGKRTRAELSGSETAIGARGFRKIFNVEDTIPLIKHEIQTWYKWNNFNDVHIIKYETLMQNKLEHLESMLDYMGYSLEYSETRKIFEAYETNRIPNFNVGKLERFRSEMSKEDIDLLNSIFSSDLKAMGYKL